MTAPNGSSPDVAYVWGEGSSFGQDVTEESAMNAMRTSPISPWEVAQQMWKQSCSDQRATLADLRDGQNGLRDRLDLLDEVSGYGAAVMGYNWSIPASTWVVLPFETQLGPAKHVSVDTDGPDSGFLTLKRGGLWRVDTQLAAQGYSTSQWFWWNGSILLPMVTYSLLTPKIMIEVVDAQGELISAQQYNMVVDFAANSSSLFDLSNAPLCASFSKTFVIPNMPDEDAEGAEDHWVRVRVSIRNDPVYNPLGTINSTWCSVLGGTQRSALTATRWSRDATNIDYADVVSDGGNLG